MMLSREHSGDQIIFSLEGALVGSYALRLREELESLLDQGVNHFIFDLAKVNSIDSIGVTALGCLREYNVRLSYRNLPYQVQEIFALDQGGRYRQLVESTV